MSNVPAKHSPVSLQIYIKSRERKLNVQYGTKRLETTTKIDIRSQIMKRECVFQNETALVICYVDDLLIFFRKQSRRVTPKTKIVERLILMNLEQPKRFLNMDLELATGIVGTRHKNFNEDLMKESGMSDSKTHISATTTQNKVNIKIDFNSKDDA